MPQNWWDVFPEIEPSPAARPLQLPGPMLPQQVFASAALDPVQAKYSAFSPPYLSRDETFDGPMIPAPYLGSNWPRAIDRDAAIQQASAAIRRGADPTAVRARLNQIGVDTTDLDAPDHFSDLVPGDSKDPAGNAVSPMQPFPQSDDFAAPGDTPRLGAISQSKDATTGYKSAVNGKIYPPPPSQHHARLTNGPGFGGPRNLSQPQRSYPVAVQNLPGGINGYGYRPVPGDAQLLARLIYSESGTTPGDMPAIGWAAVNRVGFPHHAGSAFGSTLSEVVFQRARHGRYQYSFLNDGGSQAWNESANPANIPAAARARWAQANAVANGILTGRVRDPSGGAQYFFASSRYVPDDARTAKPGFPPMLTGNRITPTPYQSTSTVHEAGRPLRNYFFREIPEKLWLPNPSPSPRR